MKNLVKMILKAFYMFLLIITVTGFAQKTYTLDAKPQLKIIGTSNIHDWDMISETASGNIVAVVENNKLTTIKSLVVELQAESLKSEKSGLDKNAYKALKTDKFKIIKFDLKSSSKQTDGTWNFTGVFTIAGVSKQVTLKVKETSTNGQYTFEGSYSFKLTDYKITPPTALLGTIKTTDAVVVNFKVKFK